ncbi:hypothetical protein [Janthinobacterium lividum]|uniref:hypothetical protein n=1 Tax=Janthinobacterium lividum TaxID=29581 RepID=UPI0011147E93|nr:hypothetical protein [Janthinobacterium lividum]
MSQDEVARQAVHSLRGYLYQLHASVAAWMRLPQNGELYLEVAEDYAELLATPESVEEILRAVQVKDTRESGSVTLNSADVLKAVQTLFSIQESNPGRPVYLTFLTTSPIGKELKDPLPSGVPALKQWSIAADGGEATELLDALRRRFTSGELGEFLKGCSVDEFKSRMLKHLTFACGEPGWEQLDEEGRDYLVRIRDKVNAEIVAARKSYDAIFSVLYKAALKPGSRMLNHESFLESFAEATTFSLPSQIAVDVLSKMSVSLMERESAKSDAPNIDEGLLQDVCQKLCDYGRPASLLPLFPDAPSSARTALEILSGADRWVVSNDALSEQNSIRLNFLELLRQRQFHHLVYAAPGSGKSHVLFRIATEMIAQANRAVRSKRNIPLEFIDDDCPRVGAKTDFTGLLPLLLPIAGMKTANEVLSLVRQLLPDSDPIKVLHSPNICVLLDGWSEFATGVYFSERMVLLRMLNGVRTIACARHADENDTTFKSWHLERLDPKQIRTVLGQAFGSSSVPSDQLVDLLRPPLMLSLYLLLGGAATSQGELIAYFHQHVSRRLPEPFFDALVDVISSFALTKERSYMRFVSALRRAASIRKLTEVESLLQQLGTITHRGNLVVPVHDLYWSWLSGIGLLRGSRIGQAIMDLDTRESLVLALQSGEHVDDDVIALSANADAVLAAKFDATRQRPSMSSSLDSVLKSMFAHSHLAIRCRAAIAGLHTGRANYVGMALQVVSEISTGKLYVPELIDALASSSLFVHRAEIAEWLGAPGTEVVIESIAANGDARWLPWIEQVYRDGRVAPDLAVAAALACGNDIPGWGVENLPNLLAECPWLLRFTSVRGVNKHLAFWIARNYSDVSNDSFESAWQSNRILASCGDTYVYEELLAHFPSMNNRAQELLGMILPELGEAWVAEFQKVAFAAAGAQHHHNLAKTVSLSIDDATARKWIALGYYHIGWKVLIARHGVNMLSELLNELPASFGGQQRIPALEVIGLLKDIPDSFIEQLDQRLFNDVTLQLGISPKVGETLIEVAAAVKPRGMAWLVRQCTSNPGIFGSYHAQLFLRLYVDWTRATGVKIEVGSKDVPIPFEEWYAMANFVHIWDDNISPEALRLVPSVAVNAVIGPFLTDDDKAVKILSRLEDLTAYNHVLFERMIGSALLVPLIAKVFSEVINLVPPNQLLRIVESEHLKNVVLFDALRAATSPSFRESHFVLVKRVIFEPLNLHNIRSVANMLQSYGRDTLLRFFQPLLYQDRLAESENLHWLLREVSIVRRELLIDEQGKLLTDLLTH